MKSMFFMPFLGQLLHVTFLVGWGFFTVIMLSKADVKKTNTPSDIIKLTSSPAITNTYDLSFEEKYESRDYDSVIWNPQFAFHFFMMLWILQFVTYWVYSILAGAIADWYFTRKDSKNNKRNRGSNNDELSKWPVAAAFMRSLKSLGSIAFAALIIAIIEFIQWVLRYLQGQMKDSTNYIVKTILRAVDCLLWCLKCCLDKINKKALIYIAITGAPLCPAFMASFKLIWQNMARCAVMFMFTKPIMFIGRATVCIGSTVLAFFAMQELNPEIKPLYPILLIVLITWVVGSNFMALYETAVDTVFVCFILDETWNADMGIMYAEKGLANIVQDNEKKSKELADKYDGSDERTKQRDSTVHPLDV